MKFSSYDGQLYRQERLAKAAKLFAAITGLTPAQLDLLVSSLHDDRGTLTVTWTLEPSAMQRCGWNEAWALVGERGSLVSHVVGKAVA